MDSPEPGGILSAGRSWGRDGEAMRDEAARPHGRCDLEAEPERAAALCRSGQQRLLADLQGLDDPEARSPSRLPGWSRGHVITHLARNADAHGRRLAGALRGEDVAKYPGGAGQREREIAEGAHRPARELIIDLEQSQERLEELFAKCSAAGWPGSELMGGGDYPATGCPAHRLREVEIHHVDLGMDYQPADWPPEYVAWDLPWFLETIPDRLRSRNDRAAMLAWLAGRAPLPPGLLLDPL
jgi:maleylpyruvate isomerase